MTATDRTLISIAMTTYNGEKYIEKQLRSIFTQSIQPQEIVICDDCSSDCTVEIICKVVAEYGAGDRVCIVENHTNLGYIRNFHQAIGLTSGDFVCLADQDDEWYPHKLERLLAVMQETGAAAICTNFDLIDEHSELISDPECFQIDPFIRNAPLGLTPITFHQLVFRNLVPGCTYCCTRQTADAFYRIDSQILPHDHQIMLVGSCLGNVYYLNEKTIQYRLHGNNTIGLKKKGTTSGWHLKKPNRKPRCMQFLDDISCELTIPHRWYYVIILYLRIPFFTGLIKNILNNFI